jgi:hypothetical protein
MVAAPRRSSSQRGLSPFHAYQPEIARLMTAMMFDSMVK